MPSGPLSGQAELGVEEVDAASGRLGKWTVDLRPLALDFAHLRHDFCRQMPTLLVHRQMPICPGLTWLRNTTIRARVASHSEGRKGCACGNSLSSSSKRGADGPSRVPERSNIHFLAFSTQQRFFDDAWSSNGSACPCRGSRTCGNMQYGQA